MSIRTYTQTDINIISEFIDGSGGSVSGIALNKVVIATQGMGAGPIHKGSSYESSFYINFSAFPAIPANALISQVRFYIDYALNVDINGIFGNPASSFASIQFNDISATFGVMTDSMGVAPPPGNGGNGDSRSARLDKTVDFPLNITRTELDLYFGIAGGFVIDLDAEIDNGVPDPAGGNASVTISNYTFEVTYTGGPFSWYLETHEDTIDGQPVTIVDDIVPVDEGTEPPVGSTFYGTGDDFPNEGDIPLYTYYYPPTNTTLIQPIPPAGPESGWYLQLAEIVSELGVELALESKVVAIVNPSGIYTLIEGKRHDTLYERLTGITSINVAIPRPYGTTGFIPE